MGVSLPLIAALLIYATLLAVGWTIQLTNMYFVPQRVQDNKQGLHKRPLLLPVVKDTKQKQNDFVHIFKHDSLLLDGADTTSVGELDAKLLSSDEKFVGENVLEKKFSVAPMKFEPEVEKVFVNDNL